MSTLFDSGACASKVMAFGRMAPLEGKKLVQMVYMDEGGISQHEPFAVVAGVMINGDRKLVAVEDYLQSLKQKYIPREDRDGFAFSAKNIFSGTKYFKDEAKWPLEKRLDILEDLVAVPHEFNLGVVFGLCRKDDEDQIIARFSGQEKRDVMYHATAFSRCVIQIEEDLRSYFNENALLIAENNDSAKQTLKTAHTMLKDGSLWGDCTAKIDGIDESLVPLRRIRDTVHFAEKDECCHLQLADVCAFVIRGHLTRHKHNQRFFDIPKPQLLHVIEEKHRL